MLFLLVHSDDLEEAFDIKEIFYNHKKVKEEPELIHKKYMLKHPSGKGNLKSDFITSIKMESN